MSDVENSKQTESKKDSQQPLRETLSALLDHQAGKQDALELRRLARELEQDAALAAVYQRYTAVSRTLRGEAGAATASASFLERVHAGIDAETVAVSRPRFFRRNTSAFMKPFGQAAVAASVALVAILFLQNQEAPLNATPAVTASVATSAAPALGATHTRLLEPNYLTVAAGDHLSSSPARSSALPMAQPECFIPAGERVPADATLMQLPSGYRVCQQGSTVCEPVASVIACRFH